MTTLFLLAIILATAMVVAVIWTPTKPYHQVDPKTGICWDCGHDTTQGEH